VRFAGWNQSISVDLENAYSVERISSALSGTSFAVEIFRIFADGVATLTLRLRVTPELNIRDPGRHQTYGDRPFLDCNPISRSLRTPSRHSLVPFRRGLAETRTRFAKEQARLSPSRSSGSTTYLLPGTTTFNPNYGNASKPASTTPTTRPRRNLRTALAHHVRHGIPFMIHSPTSGLNRTRIGSLRGLYCLAWG